MDTAKEDKIDIKLNKRPKDRSYLYACYVIELVPAFAAGCQLTYATVAVDAHQMPEAEIKLNDEMASWFASLLSIFTVIGSLCSSMISSLLGRRFCLFVSCMCINIGLLCLFLAQNASMLLFGRVLCGLGSGIGFPASYLFLHETALPRHRSTLAALNIFSLNSGNLYTLVMGWALPYEWLPLYVAIPSVLLCLSVFSIPESAVFLIERAREVEAKENLNRLWLDSRLVNAEFAWLCSHLQANEMSSRDDCIANLKYKMTWPNIKRIIFGSVLLLSQSLSGCDTIYIYSIKIAKMAKLDINKNLLSVILQLAFNIGFIIAPFLVKVCRRKPHFIYSSIGVAISMVILGLGLSEDLFDLEDEETSSSTVLFLLMPVGAALCSAFMYGVGIGSVPYTLLGELLPDPVRNLGNAVATFFRFFSVFLLLKLFPAMSGAIGLNGLFWFHACCCLGSAAFVQIFIPETKNNVEKELVENCEEKEEQFHQL